MPPTSSRQQPNRVLTLLVYTFAAVATILWLLPLFSSHNILFPGGPNFVDVTVYKGRFTLFHTAKFFSSRTFSAFAYPAGSAPIYAAFYKTSDPIETYCILSGIVSVAGLAATWFALKRARATNLFLPLVIACSFPLAFLIQRANIEIVLWLFTVIGILLYRKGLAIPAAIVIGIVAATKLYPIFLLGLFLRPATHRSRQDIPAFAIGIATFVATTIAALAYAGPTFSMAAQGFFTGVNRFQNHYVDTVSRVEVAYDHCLFSPIKYWTYSNHVSPAPYTHIYFLVAGAIALALFFRVWSLPFLNRVTFLSAAMVSLPPVSFTYTLVHLYFPLILLICALASIRYRPPFTALAAVTTLLFLMLPLMSISITSPRPTGPMQSVALLVLLLLTAITPWPVTIRSDAA